MYLDVDMQTMSNDVVAVIKELYGDSPPAIVLVGHRFVFFYFFYLFVISVCCSLC